MFAALSRDKKLGSKTKHYLCGENEDSVFYSCRPAVGLRRLGGFSCGAGWYFRVRVVLSVDFFLLTANQLVVGWFMTRQSLTTVYAIR